VEDPSTPSAALSRRLVAHVADHGLVRTFLPDVFCLFFGTNQGSHENPPFSIPARPSLHISVCPNHQNFHRFPFA
jgi:hypothetical protein